MHYTRINLMPSPMLKSLLAFTLATVLSASAMAQVGPVEEKKDRGPMKGWFFGDDPPKEEAPTKEPPPRPSLPTEPPPPPKDDKCKKKETWSTDCGFVNPGDDFQFQSKQRDALMERMSVSKNDPKAVEAFQYYMRWVLERTSEVTNLWWYNMVQNPDLDPNVRQPISSFGIRLMTDVQKGHAQEIFKLIKDEGGFFVYFSRNDCEFCHQMSETLLRLSKTTGIEVRNAALDEKCIPGFEQGCMVAPATHTPARALQVGTVPAVFLYIPKNTWLRVSTGVVDLESLKARTIQFFAAYRAALMNGTNNSQKGRPSVDFSETEPTGSSKGVSGTQEGAARELPSEDDISRMLGATPSR